MRYGVRVLSRPEVSSGFSLVGLETIEVAGAEPAREQLHELMSKPEVGVVLMEEGFYDQLPEELRRELGRRPLPMVVPFPEPAWVVARDRAEAYIVELLRQVIGYRVRLR